MKYQENNKQLKITHSFEALLISGLLFSALHNLSLFYFIPLVWQFWCLDLAHLVDLLACQSKKQESKLYPKILQLK